MSESNLKKLNKSSIYITPNFPAIETKRYKVGIQKLFMMLMLYTVIIAAITTLVLMFTPAKDLVNYFENKELEVQGEKIKTLEDRIIFLTRELNSIASTNKKLKYAMMLGTNDSIDTNSAIYDSLKATDQPNPIGGDLASIFKLVYKKIFQDKETKKQIFVKPSDGFVVKEYAPDRGHIGIDFAVKEGTPVYASSGGIVIFSNYTAEDGNMIILQHDNNYITVYKHCSSLLKKTRSFVEQGELIALSGNTGINTTGPHLHFEIWHSGKAIDPKKSLINL